MEEDSTQVPVHVTVLMATVGQVVKVCYKSVYHHDQQQVGHLVFSFSVSPCNLSFFYNYWRYHKCASLYVGLSSLYMNLPWLSSSHHCNAGGQLLQYPLAFSSINSACVRKCQNGGTLNSASCSCTCAGGFTGSNCESEYIACVCGRDLGPTCLHTNSIDLK